MSTTPKVEYVYTYEEIIYVLNYLAKKKVVCAVTVDTENAQNELNAFIGDKLDLEIKEPLRCALRQFRLRKRVKSEEKVTGIMLKLPISKSTVEKMMKSLEIEQMDQNKFRCLITSIINKEFE